MQYTVKYIDFIERGYDHGIFDRCVISEDEWTEYLGYDSGDEPFDTFELFVTSSYIVLFINGGKFPEYPWAYIKLENINDTSHPNHKWIGRKFAHLMDKPELLV